MESQEPSQQPQAHSIQQLSSPPRREKVPDVPVEVWEEKLVGKTLVGEDAPDNNGMVIEAAPPRCTCVAHVAEQRRRSKFQICLKNTNYDQGRSTVIIG